MDDPVREMMSRAVAEGVFPGAVLLVDLGGRIVVREAFGVTSREASPERVTVDTVFDLASLTKPLSTAALALGLVAAGRIALDEPVASHVPGWTTGAKSLVTLRHLLTHTSGLPDWRPFYQQIPPHEVGTPDGKRRIVERAAREPLETPPGANTRYSDLGFIVLGALIERLAGDPLDALWARHIAAPLGCESTGYATSERNGAARWLDGRRVAATETCPWRGRTLHGEIHDENAAAMGGVAGHAGLFGTADDVRRVALEWLRARRGTSRLWPAGLAATFLTRQTQMGDGSWALGWTVPTPPSTSGRYFSSESFGHLGFTGTSVWADPDRELVVILLSNRVHPTRANQSIKSFRPLLHDAVYQSVVGIAPR